MSLRAILILFFLSQPAFAYHAYDLPWVGDDLYGVPCHGKPGGFGPFDYNHPPTKRDLGMVEQYHFTPNVEALSKKNSVSHSSVVDDLDYTLRAFPNHHRALWAMIRLYLKEGRPDQPDSQFPPAECYLQRAIEFRPKDAVVYMLYGIYLQLAGFPDKSAGYYKKSLSLNPNSAETQYNYGLLLLDQKEYSAAVKHAKRAYALGYPLPGLRDRLRKAGYPLGGGSKGKKEPTNKPKK